METVRRLLVISVVFVCLLSLAGCLQDTGGIKNHTESVEPETDANEMDESDNVSGFIDVSDEVGFNYSDDYRILLEGANPSGVYVSDYDNDGRDDILALGSEGPVLFVNGENGFESTVVHEGDFTAAHFFDHDNDGYDDLYLLSDNGSVFLENAGGEFVEREVGLEVAFESVRGAATADYTGNGCLDVFVVQSNNWEKNRPVGYDNSNVTIDEGNGNKNRLFAGDCEGFEETTDEAGIEGTAWSLATSFVDFTNDGDPDIHVANDFNNDVVYFNEGNGTFERHVLPDFTNRNGMSSEVADVNGDGYLDIFVTNIYYPPGEGKVPEKRYGERLSGNYLLINQGNRSFVDGADEYGVRKARGWGWAAVLEDFDSDGSLDLAHTLTESTTTEYLAFWYGNESGFVRQDTKDMGFNRTRGLGMVDLDYDGDGKLDIAESNQEGDYRLYENREKGGNWLRVDVLGDGETTEIGTKVEVKTEDGTKTQIKSSESDYFSQDSRILHFGLGEAKEVEVRVYWPDGTEKLYTEQETNQRITVSP